MCERRKGKSMGRSMGNNDRMTMEWSIFVQLAKPEQKSEHGRA